VTFLNFVCLTAVFSISIREGNPFPWTNYSPLGIISVALTQTACFKLRFYGMGKQEAFYDKRGQEADP
jgi:hypothetical protein